jgi:hypothetical protein
MVNHTQHHSNASGVPVQAGLLIRIDLMQFRIQLLQKNES